MAVQPKLEETLQRSPTLLSSPHTLSSASIYARDSESYIIYSLTFSAQTITHFNVPADLHAILSPPSARHRVSSPNALGVRPCMRTLRRLQTQK